MAPAPCSRLPGLGSQVALGTRPATRCSVGRRSTLATLRSASFPPAVTCTARKCLSGPQPLGRRHDTRRRGGLSPGVLTGPGRWLQLWLSSPLRGHPALFPSRRHSPAMTLPQQDGLAVCVLGRPPLPFVLQYYGHYASGGKAEKPEGQGGEPEVRKIRKLLPPLAEAAQRPEWKAALGWLLFPLMDPN